MHDWHIYYPQCGWYWKWVIAIVLFIVTALVINVQVRGDEEITSDEVKALSTGKVVELKDIPKIALLYVYDEDMDLWHRARRETLINAKCEHIRGILTVASGR